MNFKNSQGQVVPLADIPSMFEEGYEYELYVGSDSQVNRKKKCVVYATCIVLYKKGKGGRVLVARDHLPYANSLRERLTNEVWRSLTVAFELQKILPANVETVIHIDVNHSRKHKSGEYNKELVSLVTGQGFKYRIKPYAWAAQCIADHFTKK